MFEQIDILRQRNDEEEYYLRLKIQDIRGKLMTLKNAPNVSIIGAWEWNAKTGMLSYNRQDTIDFILVVPHEWEDLRKLVEYLVEKESTYLEWRLGRLQRCHEDADKINLDSTS